MPSPFPASGLSFHHVGFVVADLAASAAGFVRSLDAFWDGQIFEDPNQRVRVTFLSTSPDAPQIELVEPVGPNSPVQRFCQEKGGGLHHLCFEVDRIEDQLKLMKERSAMIVSRPKPAVAFNGRRIAWVYTAEKLLVEFLERDCFEP